ncbi:hypothetical protein ACSBR1_004949 [Camellia fascicularis]
MNLPSIWLAGYMNTIFLFCLVLGFPGIATAANYGNETDRLALLAFMSNITHDPFGILSSWNESIHFCQWQGVTCGSRHQRAIVLDLAHQNLTGSISPHIGNLSFLSIVLHSLGNLSSLGKLNVAYIDLKGSIPTLLGQLSKLEYFVVAVNVVHSTIPPTIFNLSSIKTFTMTQNQIGGSRPLDLGITLPNLEFFAISGNQFTGSIPVSMSNMSNLAYLQAMENNLIGKVPNFGNLNKLSWLIISTNHLGTLEADDLSFISYLTNATDLEILALDNNNFGGLLHESFANLSTNLVGLWLGNNQMHGNILHEIANFINLTRTIPPDFDTLQNLVVLQLSQNKFSGNQITSFLPMEVGNLNNLIGLEVSNNFLSGEIPSTLGSCVALEVFYMDGNLFQGTIPSSLSPVLEEGIFKNASEFSIDGNPKPCGGSPELRLPTCNFNHSSNSTKKMGLPFKFKLTISIVSGLLGLSLVLGYGSVYKGILDLDGTVVAVKVLNLLHHGASKSFIAGCEALKDIRHRNLVKVVSACSGVDYQGNEIKALVYEFMINGSLEEWLHHNLTKNLAQVEPKMLNLLQRLNIAIDVACALDYRHNHCPTPIAYCDIKLSNVLLDNKLVGHVGDFEIARFLSIVNQNFSSNQTSSYGIRGTIGYIAPEYGMRSEVSIVLEMFTRRRPTNGMFRDGIDLHNFVEAILPDRVVEIMDPILLQEREEGETSLKNTKENRLIRYHKIQDCIISIFQVRVACSVKLAREMMNITNVVAKLQSTRNIVLEVEYKERQTIKQQSITKNRSLSGVWARTVDLNNLFYKFFGNISLSSVTSRH